MSWASHNPELYDAITRKGIVAHLQYALYKDGFEETLEAFVEMIQQDTHFRRVYVELRDMSTAKIQEAEQQYFAELADKVKEDHNG